MEQLKAIIKHAIQVVKDIHHATTDEEQRAAMRMHTLVNQALHCKLYECFPTPDHQRVMKEFMYSQFDCSNESENHLMNHFLYHWDHDVIRKYDWFINSGWYNGLKKKLDEYERVIAV